MTDANTLYSDEWGMIVDSPDEGCVEIRWLDATATMRGAEFNAFLREYASRVEAAGRPGALVDARAFRMDMAQMDSAWRDAHIIPRYNAAGVRKFAFVMPAGMPAIGAAPAKEGPATFPTGYFATREDAVAWLNAPA